MYARAEVSEARLTPDQWQQIYHYSKSARNFRSFAGHLESAQIIATADSLLAAQAIAVQASDAAIRPARPVANAELQQSAQFSEVSPTTQQDGGKTMPHPTLTHDWAHQHARENIVMVTWSNWHFVDFVENWAAHLSNHRAYLYTLLAASLRLLAVKTNSQSAVRKAEHERLESVVGVLQTSRTFLSVRWTCRRRNGYES